jgi:hypothetical protein
MSREVTLILGNLNHLFYLVSFTVEISFSKLFISRITTSNYLCAADNEA